jgi:hypothetical protein
MTAAPVVMTTTSVEATDPPVVETGASVARTDRPIDALVR